MAFQNNIHTATPPTPAGRRAVRAHEYDAHVASCPDTSGWMKPRCQCGYRRPAFERAGAGLGGDRL